MPLLYKAFKSSLPSKDGKKKWYPRLVKFKKVVDTQQIGARVAAKSSLTAGDVHNVTRNIVDVMADALMNSQTVRLDGFGTFTVIAKTNGNGVDSPEDVSSSQIDHLKIQFTPSITRTSGGSTRTIFNGVSYERWEKGSADVVMDGDEQPDDELPEEGQTGDEQPGTEGGIVDPNA
jgi:predicted histone-like DNA-binding protein